MAPHRKKTRTEQESGRRNDSSEPVAGLTRATETDDAGPRGRIARAARSVRGAISRLIHHGDHETPIATESERTAQPSAPKSSRATRRTTDIPMDELDRVHTPQQTSLKGSFRDDGRDRHNDQEFASGVSDNGWNDEDRFTNKSGDPRIGTHGRTYEAAERSRNDENE